MNDTRFETLLGLFCQKNVICPIPIAELLAALSQLMRLPSTVDDRRTLLAALLPQDCDRYFEGYLQPRIAAVRAFIENNTLPAPEDGNEVLIIVTSIALTKNRRLLDQLRCGQLQALSAWDRNCYLPQLQALATDNNPAQDLINALVKSATPKDCRPRFWKLDFPDNPLGQRNYEDVARFCHRLGVCVSDCQEHENGKRSLIICGALTYDETSFLKFVTSLAVHGRGCFVAHPVKEIQTDQSRKYDSFEDRMTAHRKALAVMSNRHDDPLAVFFKPLRQYIEREVEWSLPCFSARLAHPSSKTIYEQFPSSEILTSQVQTKLLFVGQTDLTLAQALTEVCRKDSYIFGSLSDILQTASDLLFDRQPESFVAEFLLQMIPDQLTTSKHLFAHSQLQTFFKADCNKWPELFKSLDAARMTMLAALIFAKLKIQSEHILRKSQTSSDFDRNQLDALYSTFKNAEDFKAKEITDLVLRLLPSKGRIVRKITPLNGVSLRGLSKLMHRVAGVVTALIDENNQTAYLSGGLLSGIGEIRFMTALSAYLQGFVMFGEPERLLEDEHIDFRHTFIGGFMEALRVRGEANIFNSAIEANPLIYYMISDTELFYKLFLQNGKTLDIAEMFVQKPVYVADRQTADFHRDYVKKQFEEIVEQSQAGQNKLSALDQ